MVSHSTKILGFLLGFFSLRLAFAYFLGWSAPIGDGGSYNAYALAILRDPDWLLRPDFLGNSRAPGYPCFLAAIYSIFGDNKFFVVYVFQSFLNTLTVYYIYRISRLLLDRNTAIAALLWSGFNIFFIWNVRTILRETLVCFLLIFSFFHLWLVFTKPNGDWLKNGNFWLFVAGFTFLLHTDPRYFFYLPFLLILFAVYLGFYSGLKQYIWFIVITGCLLVPWTVRNYLAYDALVLVNTRTLDLRPKSERKNTWEKRRLSPLTDVGEIRHAEVNTNYPSEDERILVKQGLNPNQRGEEEIAAIQKDIYPVSGFWERKVFWFLEFWRIARFSADYFPFPDARFQGRWSFRHNLAGILCLGVLLPFMLVGIFHMIKERNRALVFLVFPIFVQTLLHVLLWGRYRYRVPIDGFIIILGCYGITETYDRIKKTEFGKIISKLRAQPNRYSPGINRK